VPHGSGQGGVAYEKARVGYVYDQRDNGGF
jgi:hypothetical protein